MSEVSAGRSLSRRRRQTQAPPCAGRSLPGALWGRVAPPLWGKGRSYLEQELGDLLNRVVRGLQMVLDYCHQPGADDDAVGAGVGDGPGVVSLAGAKPDADRHVYHALEPASHTLPA